MVWSWFEITCIMLCYNYKFTSLQNFSDKLKRLRPQLMKMYQGSSRDSRSLLDKNEKKVEEGISGLNEADKEAIENDTSSRQARGFCKDSYGVFCMLYNALAGSKVIFTYQSQSWIFIIPRYLNIHFHNINLTKVRYLEVRYLL